MTDHHTYVLGIITASALLAYVILWSGLQTFNANPTNRFMRIWIKLILYYAAYTMPMWALLIVIGWAQQVTPLLSNLSGLTVLAMIVITGLYFYTVIVQPNRLRLHHQALDLNLKAPLTVAVLADLRIGLYSGKPRHIRKLVATINNLSADVILITGDWLYYPGADLVGQLMLFKGVNKPIHTVMSISDLRYQSINTTKQGEPLLEDTLASAFDVLDIDYIGQQCHLLMSKPTVDVNQQLTDSAANTSKANDLQQLAMLCGWQDMPRQSATSIIPDVFNKSALATQIAEAVLPVIILASRVDSITDLPNSLHPRPLLIAGAAKTAPSTILTAQKRQVTATTNSHSTVFANFNNNTNKRGLYQHSSAQVFISSGIGTRGLPFRLHRPTIDVLTIR